MKLVELFERITAPVHENEAKSLFVISNLIKKRFGVRNPSGGGVCLLAQVVESIAATTGLKPNDLINQFYKKAGSHLYYEGTTLETIMKTLESVPIKKDDEFYKLKLSMTKYNTTNAMLTAIKSGQPAILVASNYGAFRNMLDNIETYSHHDDATGIATLDKIEDELKYSSDKGSDREHHAYLVIGYDSAEKTVIMRDIRDSYGYKGYYKVERAIFDKFWKLIRIVFSVDVEDMKKIKKENDGKATDKSSTNG